MVHRASHSHALGENGTGNSRKNTDSVRLRVGIAEIVLRKIAEYGPRLASRVVCGQIQDVIKKNNIRGVVVDRIYFDLCDGNLRNMMIFLYAAFLKVSIFSPQRKRVVCLEDLLKVSDEHAWRTICGMIDFQEMLLAIQVLNSKFFLPGSQEIHIEEVTRDANPNRGGDTEKMHPPEMSLSQMITSLAAHHRDTANFLVTFSNHSQHLNPEDSQMKECLGLLVATGIQGDDIHTLFDVVSGGDFYHFALIVYAMEERVVEITYITPENVQEHIEQKAPFTSWATLFPAVSVFRPHLRKTGPPANPMF